MSRRSKFALLALGLVVVLVVMPLLLLQRNASTPAGKPVKTRIDVPLVLVRGGRCLLTESKAHCKARFPAK